MDYPYQIKSLEEYKAAYKKSIETPEEFWAEIARNFLWRKPWDKVLEWNFTEPNIKWFINGKLNITENCIDRHLEELGNKPAIIWEPNNPEDRVRIVTYNRLHKRVCQFAQVLKNNGVKKGDRVCIYMGMVPELAYAVLGCARIGAIHSVIFGGFSAQSIADRLEDAGAEYIITCDGAYRGEKIIPLKDVIDDALIGNKKVKKVIVYTRTRTAVSMIKGRDVWWEDEMEHAEQQVEKDNVVSFPATEVDAEDPLFILYTSGSTGKPKGVVHTSGGYMVWTGYTFVNTFQYQQGDVFFCTADIGWVTGHSYMVYAPLLHGVTSVIYEGTPDFPTPDRYWALIEKHRATILYTTPTALRIYMKYDLSIPNSFDLSSLRLLGTVGEAINPEVWLWYFRVIGKEKCPIVDTWWQTETGGIMISQCLGIDAIPMKPGSGTFPVPGVDIGIVDEKGMDVNPNNKGYLVIKRPWPGMLMTLWNNDDKYINTYWNKFQGFYYSGDFALLDQDNYIWLLGRSDDVLKIAGHRLGTMELESAFVSFNAIAEAAVISKPDEEKGEAIVAFLVLKAGYKESPEMRTDLVNHIRKTVGPIATPNEIYFTNKLPKTRSGKIMRRLLKSISTNSELIGDTSTLEDEASVEEIKQVYRDFQDITKQ